MKTKEELEAEAAAAAKAEAEKTAGAPPAGDKGDSGSDDENMSPEDMKKIIKDLRKENAKTRTAKSSQEEQNKSLSEQLSVIKKHLGIEEEAADPVEQLKSLQAKNENTELELSLSQLARAHGIPLEQDDYFRFLMAKKFVDHEKNAKDGEEISDEEIAEVVAKVQVAAGAGATKPNNNSTGVSGGAGTQKPSGGGNGTTPEQFAKMSIGERSKLYIDNRPEYDRLNQAVKDKKLKLTP